VPAELKLDENTGALTYDMSVYEQKRFEAKIRLPGVDEKRKTAHGEFLPELIVIITITKDCASTLRPLSPFHFKVPNANIAKTRVEDFKLEKLYSSVDDYLLPLA
jgi:hypothetical protein